MTPKPVCVACRREMSCESSGHTVEFTRLTNSGQQAPYEKYQGDLWRCPGCSYEIISGYSFRPLAQHFDLDGAYAALPPFVSVPELRY